MKQHSIWCPNVILLDPGSLEEYPIDQVIKIKNSIPNNLTFLFVAIGSYSHIAIESQIILKQTDYSIYKEEIKYRNTITSVLFEAGIQHAYYINAKPEFTKIAFIHFIDILGFDYPILCLASKLSTYLHPAAYVIPKHSEPKSIEKKLDIYSSNCYTTDEFATKKISFINKKIVLV